MNPIIIVHGGAAVVAPERISGKMLGIRQAVSIGYELINSEGSAVDAVETAIVFMENNEYFNAGMFILINY